MGQQERDMRALEYVYDNDRGSRGPANASGLWELIGDHEGRSTALALVERGLLTRDNRLGSGYRITSEGRSEVERMKERRSDRRFRRETCRAQFLRWVDDNTTTNSGQRMDPKQFQESLDLVPFTEEETQNAAAYLAERRLIESIKGGFENHHILVWINETGREALDELDAAAAGLTHAGSDSGAAAGEDLTMAVPTIFLVHGHDEGLRDKIEMQLRRWITQVDIVILDQQASKGRTLVEKFEQHADTAAFAVVLATPDDEGRAFGGPDLKPRARQNVIFELGYFFGKLGRDRVVVVNAGVEKPSDVDGIVYIDPNTSDWRQRLGRELKAAEIDGDWLR